MTTTINALSKILVILKSTGCFPFYSYVNNYRLKQTRKFYKSYSLGIFLLTQIIASFFLYAAIDNCPIWFPFKYKNPTDSTNQLFEVILCVSVYSLMQLLCVFNFSRFIEILNAILDIELDLKRKFRRELTNRKLEAYNTVILIYIVAVIIYMVVITAEKISNNPNNSTFILYLFQLAMSASYVVFFTSLVKLTVVRLKVVNNLFQTVSETPDDNLKLFFQVVEIYKLVEKTFGMIDDSNGLILLFYLAYVFYTLTNEIYSFAFLILLQRGEMWNYTSSVLWIIHQVWVLWELSMNCGVVPGEVRSIDYINTYK